MKNYFFCKNRIKTSATINHLSGNEKKEIERPNEKLLTFETQQSRTGMELMRYARHTAKMRANEKRSVARARSLALSYVNNN